MVREFGASVARQAGREYPEDQLRAALRSVRFLAKQATAKLSPVTQKRAPNGRPASRKALPPYCASTYASFESCPRSCPFLLDPETGSLRGCFVAASVNQRRCTDPLDAAARTLRVEERGVLIALAEAFRIRRFAERGVPQDGQRGGRDLRLHVSGDAVGPQAAAILAGAADFWRQNGGGVVWTFTHAWRVIPRDAWGDISVLASVETASAIEAAHRQGYAAAVALPEIQSPRAFFHPEAPDFRIVPCPAEQPSKGRPRPTCVSCRLCLDDHARRAANSAIGFAAHSRDVGLARDSMDASVAAERAARRRSLPVIAERGRVLTRPNGSLE